jgi:organic hydroperoxide reductase OsmC/OhrA
VCDDSSMAAGAREFRYTIELAESGTLSTENGASLDPADAWTPEHLLLAALARCSLDSLRHHARRAGSELAAAAGSAGALVTKRESDGRYAVVEAELTLDVRLEPLPDGHALAELLAKAERDCFVGASLAAKPSYTWNVS